MAHRQVLAPLAFFIQEGMPRHITVACTEVLKQLRNDPTMRLWQTVAKGVEGRGDEALRDLRLLEQDSLVGPAAMAASLYIHQQSLMVDSEAIARLQGDLEMLESSASDESRVELARVHWCYGQRERARGLLEDVTLLTSKNVPAQSLLGWVILSQVESGAEEHVEGEDPMEDAAKALDSALAASDLDAEAALGRVRLYRLQGLAAEALSLLAQVIARYSWLVPAEVERMRVFLGEVRWEEALESAQRALQADDTNADALAMLALSSAAKDGRLHVAARYLGDLLAALQTAEPRQWRLLSAAGAAFAKMATHDEDLAAAARQLAEAGVRAAPQEAKAQSAMAACLLALGDHERALALYNRAAEADVADVGAMTGGARCLVLLGRTEEARIKVDGLIEGFRSFQATDAEIMAVAGGGQGPEVPKLEGMGLAEQATLYYLRAALSWLAVQEGAGESAESELRVAYLEQAMVCLGNLLKTHPVSLQAAAAVDTSLCLDLALLMLQHVAGEPLGQGEAALREVDLTTKHLQRLSKVFPGHPGIQCLLATCLLMSGSTDAAMKKAGVVLLNSPEVADAHLIVIRAHLQDKNTALARKALDVAVAQSYKIRLTPQYHMSMARLLLRERDAAQALKFLQQAEKMPGMRGRTLPRVPGSKHGAPLTLHDKTTVLLLQADALNILGKKPEAQKILAKAAKEAAGTPEEVIVALASTDMKIANGDVSGAMRDMEAVPPTSPLFIQARTALARIYLDKRRDRAAYTKCYQDIIDRFRDKRSYMLFGEAMVHIQEPLKAVEALKEALRRDPRDASLALRIGAALVATHDFEGAVSYYEKAVNANRGNVELQLELAGLLARVGRGRAAQQMLQPFRDAQGSVEAMQARVKALCILSDLERRQGNAVAQIELLGEALRGQEAVVEAVRGEPAEVVAAERRVAADLAFRIFRERADLGVAQDGMVALREVLQRNPAHHQAGLAIARMHLAAGDVNACMTQCEHLLTDDDGDEEASMLLAEVAAMQGDVEPALGRFQVILARKPDHFRALFRLLDVLKRTGNLASASDYLEAARHASPRTATSAGYQTCEGALHRSCNRPQEALRCLNRARGDPEWGRDATYMMADIYLDPNSERLWAAAGDDEDSIPDNFQAAASGENLKAVAELLATVRPVASRATVRHKVLEAYTHMASGEKADAEQALSALLDLANKDRDHVPTLLAMATAFMLLRQKPKARNQLKRIAKMPYTPEYGEDFEKAWLSLASMHLKGGKFDLAQELCQKCLKYNRSCAQAWELMGQMLEKEGAYKDAAEHYHHAWDLVQGASAQSGYRLAFNYMKAGQAVKAMEVAQTVLDKFPEYVQIKADVLQRVWAMVKPPSDKA